MSVVTTRTCIYVGIFVGLVCLYVICSSGLEESFANPNAGASAGSAGAATGGTPVQQQQQQQQKSTSKAKGQDTASQSKEEVDEDMYVYQPIDTWKTFDKQSPVCTTKSPNAVRPLYTTGASSSQLDMGTLMDGQNDGSLSLFNISNNSAGYLHV